LRTAGGVTGYVSSLRLLRQQCLTQPETEVERQVATFCQQQVWGREDLARYYHAQAIALAAEGDQAAADEKIHQAQAIAPHLNLGC
jgi:hypothetical protein